MQWGDHRWCCFGRLHAVARLEYPLESFYFVVFSSFLVFWWDLSSLWPVMRRWWCGGQSMVLECYGFPNGELFHLDSKRDSVPWFCWLSASFLPWHGWSLRLVLASSHCAILVWVCTITHWVSLRFPDCGLK